MLKQDNKFTNYSAKQQMQQKHPFAAVLQNRRFLILQIFFKKIHASESFFNESRPATLLKRDFGTGVFL